MLTVGAVKAVDMTLSVDELKQFLGGPSADLGGSTSDNWTVGGNLAVTGTTALTGALTVTGDLNKTGDVTDATSTLTGPLTLTAAQVCDSNVITVNSGVTTASAHNVAASLDITLPATSTLFVDCLSTEGDPRSFIFCNQSPTAATTTQIVAGTGIKVTVPDGQNTNIGGGACAKVDIQRAVLSVTENAIANVDEWIDD